MLECNSPPHRWASPVPPGRTICACGFDFMDIGRSHLTPHFDEINK